MGKTSQLLISFQIVDTWVLVQFLIEWIIILIILRQWVKKHTKCLVLCILRQKQRYFKIKNLYWNSIKFRTCTHMQAPLNSI